MRRSRLLHLSSPCKNFSRAPQRISPTTSEGLTRYTDFFEKVELLQKQRKECKPSQVTQITYPIQCVMQPIKTIYGYET
jgi:hypothetical protein